MSTRSTSGCGFVCVAEDTIVVGGRSEDVRGKWEEDEGDVVFAVDADGGKMDNEEGPASLPVSAR